MTAYFLHLNITYAVDAFQMNEKKVAIRDQGSENMKIWIFKMVGKSMVVDRKE